MNRMALLQRCIDQATCYETTYREELKKADRFNVKDAEKIENTHRILTLVIANKRKYRNELNDLIREFREYPDLDADLVNLAKKLASIPRKFPFRYSTFEAAVAGARFEEEFWKKHGN
jgi:hypothetical protein